MSTKMHQDLSRKGQSAVIFFVIMASTMVIVSIAVWSLGDYLKSFGRGVSIYGGFSDVANCIANDITTLVIFTPHNTKIRYVKEVPSNIGGKIYYINYSKEYLTVYDESYSYGIHLSGLRWEGDINFTSVSAGVVVIDVGR